MDGVRGAGAGRADRPHRRGPARRRGGLRARARPHLPGGVGPRSRLGWRRADPGAPVADRRGQSLPRDPGAVAAPARPGARPAADLGPARRQGAGAGQAGAGDRRRRRSQPVLHRPAGLGQVDAGQPPARPVAATVGRRVARDLHGPFGGRADRQGGADAGPAVPQSPSLGLDGRAHWRGPARQAGRGQPGPQWGAVPGRAARVQPPGAGQPARAAGDRRGLRRPRQRSRPLSGPGAAGRRHEPL